MSGHDASKSTSFYTWFKQISSPTTVNHSLYCNLISSTEKCLVTVGGTKVTVYTLIEIKPDPEEVFEDEAAAYNLESKRLKYVLSFDVYERIEDMASARFFGDKRDSLLLSFRDAKVSVLQYDPAVHDVKTISLHYYEFDHLRQGRIQFTRPPFLRVDPDSRCAVCLVYDRHLAIMPFRRDPLHLSSVAGGQPSTAGGVEGSTRSSPVQTSYTVNLTSYASDKIANVLDMQFLNDYFEPTLLILYEPIGTWAGRVSARQDTCAIAALSLNLQARTSPVIWSLQHLPYDCQQVLSVPKPIGGVIILAVNSFIFLNQSQPPCGIALNSYVEGSTEFPMRKSSCSPIALDCCRAAFINSDQIALALKTGELFVLTVLVNRAMRTVTGIHYTKAAKSIIVQSMTLCGNDYMFLGSKLADSVLLKYTEMDADMDTIVKIYTEEDEEAAAAQRSRHGASCELDDLDVEMYGEEAGSELDVKRVVNYNVKECDRIFNLGPITRITCGEVSSAGTGASELTERGHKDVNAQLVVNTGWGEFGGLAVLQRTMAPFIHKTFDLPESTDLWALKGPRDNVKYENNGASAEESGSTQEDYHKYLLITREDSTMVLETGADMVELETSGFCTDDPTVFASNIGEMFLNDMDSKRDYPFILQVSPNAVRLLDGSQLIENHRILSEWRIRCCSLVDPFALLCTEDDEFFLIQLHSPNKPLPKIDPDYPGAVHLSIAKPKTSGQVSVPLCYCLYHDHSSFISDHISKNRNLPVSMEKEGVQFTGEEFTAPAGDMDASTAADIRLNHSMSTNVPMDSVEDEDLLLYGESMDYVKDETNYAGHPPPPPDYPSDAHFGSSDESVTPSSHWAFIIQSNGTLEIYSVPDFHLCYEVRNFVDCPTILADHRFPSGGTGQSGTHRIEDDDHMPNIKEILVTSFEDTFHTRINLFVRTANELITYEAFSFSPSLGEPSPKTSPLPRDSQLRWRRLNTFLLRAPRRVLNDLVYEELGRLEGRQCLRKFQHLGRDNTPSDTTGGVGGVFVCGRHPLWVVSSAPGSQLTYFPMVLDGVISGWTHLHMATNQHGFAYFNHSGELRLANLPSKFYFTSEFAFKKVLMKATAHFLQYHVNSKTYIVIGSTASPKNSVYKLNAEGDKELEEMERDERCVLPLVESYFMDIYSPSDDWGVVPTARIDFEDWEVVSAMATVQLTSQETHRGVKDFISMGTNLSYGEEIPVRGKILLMDVIEVVPEPGQPLTRHKVKMIYDQEQKGPVTALSSCNGFLIAAIGQKIYIWMLKDNDLVGVAFVDSEVYVHSLHCLKNLILAADVLKSIQLLRFQPRMRVLSLVSKDNRPRQILATNYFVDNKNLGFVVVDNECNLLIYAYDPIDKQSRNGKRLLRRADLKLPGRVGDTLRIRNRLRDPSILDRPNTTNDPDLAKHSVYMGSGDGAIYRLSPIRDKLLSRLRIIEKNLLQSTAHYAGLHPKAARQYRYSEPELVNVCGNVADGDLLWRYLNLPHSQRIEIAKKAGQHLDSIMDDITDLEATTLHF